MTDPLEQERCPECHLPPELSEHDGLYFQECKQHGHVACGPTIEKAIANFNHYVTRWIELRGKALI